MRTTGRTLILALALGCSNCSDSNRTDVSSPPLAPTAVPPAPSPSVIAFTDPRSGLSTSDVRDAQEQIVHFNTAGELIWTADGTRFSQTPQGERFLGSQAPFEVLFGTKDGERRAYLTFSMNYHHYDPPPTVVDLEVVDGRLVFSDTKPPTALPGS
jgi:hypothetical protein